MKIPHVEFDRCECGCGALKIDSVDRFATHDDFKSVLKFAGYALGNWVEAGIQRGEDFDEEGAREFLDESLEVLVRLGGIMHTPKGWLTGPVNPAFVTGGPSLH